MGIGQKYRKPKIIDSNPRVSFWLRIPLLIAILLAVGWYGYEMGSEGHRDGLAVFKPSLQTRLKRLEGERDQLKRQLAMAQQSAEMDQEAIRAMKEQVRRFQDERLKMEEELAFLHGIVSTGADKKGLRIQKFQLSSGLREREFNYSFTVSQVINSGLVAKGRVNISLEGLRGGQAKTLGLDKLTEDKQKSHKMRFRYFQNVEGGLRIPEGFEPAKLIIEVKPDSKKFAPVKETYDWKPVT